MNNKTRTAILIFLSNIILVIGVLFSCISAQAQFRMQSSSNEIINKLIAPYRGKSLSLAQIDKIVKEISASGLFQMVYAEHVGGNKVRIRAQEALRILDIIIQGNESYDSAEILKEMDLEKGKPASTLEIRQAINKVKALYTESGYYNFDISYRKQHLEKGINLIVKIDESQSCTIADIKIFSQNNILNRKLRTDLQSFVNAAYKKVTANEIQKRIEDFLLEERYLTAKVSDISARFNPKKTRVKIRVSISNPIQFEFIFSGNKHFSHFDLIKQSQIQGKFLYLSNSSSEIIDNLKTFYVASGFAKVEIHHQEQFYPDLNKKVLVFQIDEGSRYRLGSINVGGKISKSASTYESKIKSFLGESSNAVYFVREEIDEAVEKLVNELKTQGFFQAQLLSIEETFNKNNYVDIQVQIDEGILTYIRQVLFRGAKSFNSIELKDVVGLTSNRPLVLSQVEKSFDKVDRFYRDQGYLEFSFKNRDASVIKYKPGQPYADIVFEIHEGPKIKVGSILVNGNNKTAEYVILRELDFEIGETLTQEKVDLSIQQLERTTLFSQVSIQSLEKGSKKSTRTIVVEVSERNPGLFSAGLGGLWENTGDRGVTTRGFLGVSYNNLWGKARRVSARLDLQYSLNPKISYLEHRLALNYFEPFLFKNRIRGLVALVREDQVFDTSSTIPIIQRTNEIRFLSEKEFGRHYKLTYKIWGYEDVILFDRSKSSNDPNTQTDIGTIGPLMEFDFRNDRYLPTAGHYTRWDTEFSAPFLGSSRGVNSQDNNSQEIMYWKTELGTNFYVPLTKNHRWVWANSLRGGYLRNLSSKVASGIPSIKAFFLGGTNSVRGFQVGTGESIPGKIELCKGLNVLDGNGDCEITDITIPEDSAYYMLKSELRIPLTENLGMHVFYDGGSVLVSGATFRDPWRDAVGFGFNYKTPVGLAVLEVGYKLDRQTRSTNVSPTDDEYIRLQDESEFVIHFSIGAF